MNKNKTLYITKFIISTTVLILSFFSFTTEFYFLSKIFYLQLGPNIASLIVSFSVSTLLVCISILILTFLFGRFYCSLICPLGILQDFLTIFSLKKNIGSKNFYKTRYTIFALVFSALFLGWTIGFKFLEPYTNFGIIISTFKNIFLYNTQTLPLSLFILFILISFIPFIILILLVVFKKRIFCTMICPVGTLLGIFSKYGLFRLVISNKCVSCGTCLKKCPTNSINLENKVIDNETCVRCLRCIANCPKQGINYSIIKKEKIKFNVSRRNFVIGSALVLSGVAIGISGAIKKGKILLKDKIRALLPPGAKNQARFYLKCTNCQLCVSVCPTKVIHPKDCKHLTIYMDYSRNFCDYSCNKCSSVCPTGALEKMTLQQKQLCRIGLVKINRDACIACGLCATKCPVKALKVSDKKLEYNASVCIGCGSCQSNCLQKALEVVAIVEQTKIV